MPDMTPTEALATAPSTARKTNIITAANTIVSEIDGAVTDSINGNTQAWTLAVAGSPTGGTYTITVTDARWGARTTSALAHNAAAATVQAALRLLTGDGLDQTTVSATGTSPNFTHTIQFKGTQKSITVTATSSLTGGSPTLTPNQTSAFAAVATIKAMAAAQIKSKFIDWLEELGIELKGLA